MKMFAIALLSVLTVPSYAQDVFGSLKKYQENLQGEKAQAVDKSTPAAVSQAPIMTKSKTSGQCMEDDQTSLPLSHVTAMIMQRDGKLELSHNSLEKKLTVSSPEMISNCASMIEWVSVAKGEGATKTYSVEAKIKKGENCDEKGCTYKAKKVIDGQFQGHVDVKAPATVKGFESCLQQAGVIEVKEKVVDGKKVSESKVVESAIYSAELDEKFEGYEESGNVLFVSHGPNSKAKYGRFVEIDKCDHFENILPVAFSVKSLKDEQAEAYQREYDKVKDCKVYQDITKFIDNASDSVDELEAIRDNLIIEATKKAVAAIAAGDPTADLSVLKDFEEFIVQKLVDQADAAFELAQSSKGPEKEKYLAELKGYVMQLSKFNAAPFLTTAIMQKLESLGQFEVAKQVNGMKALIVTRGRLGAIENKELITPAVANKRVLAYNKAYAAEAEEKSLRFRLSTGQETGVSKIYAEEMSRKTQNIQVRTRNFNQAIAEEYQAMQGCGRKILAQAQQRCYLDAQENIRSLQAQLQHYNNKDAEAGQALAAKANEYAKLEKTGSDYMARTNGGDPQAPDTMSPTRGTNQSYTFEYQSGTQQQVQQNPNGVQTQQGQQQWNPYNQQSMFSQQTNPYAQMNGGAQTQQYQIGAYAGFGQQQNGYNQYNQYNQLAQYGQQFPQQQQQQQWNPYGQQSMFGQQSNPYAQQPLTGNQYATGGQFNLGFNLGGYQGQPQQQYGYNPYSMGNYNMYSR